ncbi:MAG TPA: hypothetical protein VGE39_15790 [Prosthecobacter sp.]
MKDEWKCFHCGEVFTDAGSAAEHFGRTEAQQPGCIIKVELGGERGLLRALRTAEAELARYREEDGDVQRSLAAVQQRHAPALMAAEEAGYARGLRDAGYGKTEDLDWPDHLPQLPPLPGGFDCWVYRGVKWASRRAVMVTSFDETMDKDWDPVAMFETRGDEHTHYIEAVIHHCFICKCGLCMESKQKQNGGGA